MGKGIRQGLPSLSFGEHKNRLFEIKISQYTDDSCLYLTSKHSLKISFK